MRPWFHRAKICVAVLVALSCESPITPNPIDNLTSVRPKLDSKLITVAVGEERQLSSDGVAATSLNWRSSNPEVVSVTSTGLISAHELGVATLVVRGRSSADTALINVRAPAQSVELAVDSIVLAKNQSALMPFSAFDSFGNLLQSPVGGRVEWTSTDRQVATVDSAGIVSAVSPGLAHIVLTIDGRSDTTAVTVVGPAAETWYTTVTPSQLSVGQTAQATAVNGSDGSTQWTIRSAWTAPWKSSNVDVARVSVAGVVTAVAEGTALITAGDGVTGGALVTVSNAPRVVEVLVSVGRQGLSVGESTIATATLVGSGGQTLSSQPVTWSSSNPTIASVSESGIVNAIAGGGATITATYGDMSGHVSVTVTQPVQTNGGNQQATEPVFEPGTGALIYADSIDNYSSTSAMWADVGSSMRIRQGFSEDADALSLLAPGRGGFGKALRMRYAGLGAAHDWDVVNAPVLPDSTTHFLQFSGRFTISALTGVLAIKFFEAYHRDYSRVQWNTHDHLPCPTQARGIGTYFQVIDRDVTNCQGNQAVGPYAQDVIVDHQWHRYTFQFKANTSRGSRDGIARMWIDGIKVIDISASAVGVTPPGGYKTWCDVDDIDALSTQGIEYIRWGGQLSTEPGSPFTLDIDDFVWWRAK